MSTPIKSTGAYGPVNFDPITSTQGLVTREQYDVLVIRQQGRCAGCEQPERNLIIDHHRDGHGIRGLLCYHCRAALGSVENDPERLSALLIYLQANLPPGVTHAR